MFLVVLVVLYPYCIKIPNLEKNVPKLNHPKPQHQTNVKIMQENPFKLCPVRNEEDLIGYERERQEFLNALSKQGILLILSDVGFGKSSMILSMSTKNRGTYVERAEKEKVLEKLREELNILEKILQKDPTNLKRPIFIDECSAFNNETVSLLNNINDKEKKIVLSMTHSEKKFLSENFPSIFDRVKNQIILNGFTKEEAKEFIEKKSGAAFSSEVVNEITERFRKPRDIVRICHNLWGLKEQMQKERATREMLRNIMPEIKENEELKGKKTQNIFEFVKNNPGCKRKQIAENLNMNRNSVTNLVSILLKKQMISRTSESTYFASTQSINTPNTQEAQTQKKPPNIQFNTRTNRMPIIRTRTIEGVLPDSKNNDDAKSVKKEKKIFQTVIVAETGEIKRGNLVDEREDRILTLLNNCENGLDANTISIKLKDNLVNIANNLKALMEKQRIVREIEGKKALYKIRK